MLNNNNNTCKINNEMTNALQSIKIIIVIACNYNVIHNNNNNNIVLKAQVLELSQFMLFLSFL